MGNPLSDLQKLVQSKPVKTFTAKVQRIDGSKVYVSMGTGNLKAVWGTAKVGETVMVSGSQIIAVVSGEDTTKVYIP